MIAEGYTIEIGSELRQLLVLVLVPVATAFAAWIGTRGTRKEMKTNGGTTLRDAVDRTEQHSGNADEKLDEVLARVTRLETVRSPLPPPPPPADQERDTAGR